MQQGFLHAELGSTPLFVHRFRPVVGVIGNANHDLLRGNKLQNLAEIFYEPILGGDRPRSGGDPVLIGVHQHDGVALLA